MKLDQVYNRDDFFKFLDGFLPEDFTVREEDIVTSKERCKKIHKAQVLGESESLGLSVLEVEHESENDPRVSIATDAFKILADHWIHKALVVFKSTNSENYRLSLLTISLDLNEKNKTVRRYSNARRYSFYLGPGAKINTPTKYLLKSGRITDFDDLKDRFSLEVVNKDFYKEISHLFAKLVGGSFGNGKNKKEYEPLLELPSVAPKSQTSLEFGVRLIGRVIFCWFLREKKSESGVSLMPSELLSHASSKECKDYYHTVLEPIFFEILNRSVKSRKDQFADELFSLVPYLNGGLFSPQNDDYYSYNEGKQVIYHNTVKVPDEWIREFFEFLETYNFTIDENISFDEELSIDPEMLGRIFENLLAEINPETGESARKSTGSYYTPRTIVDYMVDESIFAYLQNKTGLEEEKLRAVISYDLLDDQKYPLNEEEKGKVVSALSEVKILDPACGSGAFPIGALQKIVFILQQVDPNGQEWFKQQIKNTSPEIRRVIEREFEDKNFDYIRKLGVIRENIFGVDIQPIATEISRLRCFLTLVVDENVRDGEDNRGIEPLPNLDFKFVTANSLIGLPVDPSGEIANQGGLFEDRSGIEELQELRSMFFTASGTEREQIKLQFVQAQNRIFQRLIQSGSTRVAELTTRLTSWDPFSHKTSPWFDSEWMFGVKNGFDIVIANPPWGAKLTKEEKSQLKNHYPEIDSSTPNSFAYFIGMGWNMTSGNLSYVLPDSFLIKDFAKTRKLLSPFVFEVVWYQNTGLPEKVRPFVYVEHDVCVVLADKTKEVPSFKASVWQYDSKKDCLVKKLNDIDKSKVVNRDFNFAYNLTVEETDLKLLAKLLSHTPLELFVQCHEGIHTGNIRNKLFLKKDNNVNCKPLFYGAGTGGDFIENYYSERNGWCVDYRKEIIDKENGEYASLRDERIFNQPKIYISRTGNPFKAFLDEGNYASNNFFSLQFKDYEKNSLEELKSVIPFILSKVTHYFIRKFAAPRLGNTFVETKIIHLLKMRIPDISSDQKTKLVQLVDSVYLAIKNGQKDRAREIQEQIDKEIYKIYDLTPEEIKIVDENGKAVSK